jgi:hypothetical protein
MRNTDKLAIVRGLQDNPRLTALDFAEELEVEVNEVAAYIATLDRSALGREVQKLYGFRR